MTALARTTFGGNTRWATNVLTPIGAVTLMGDCAIADAVNNSNSPLNNKTVFNFLMQFHPSYHPYPQQPCYLMAVTKLAIYLCLSILRRKGTCRMRAASRSVYPSGID